MKIEARNVHWMEVTLLLHWKFSGDFSALDHIEVSDWRGLLNSYLGSTQFSTHNSQR